MALKKAELIQLWEFQSLDLTPELKKQLLKVTGRGNTSAARDYIHANAVLAEVSKVKDLSNYKNCKSVQELMECLNPAVRFRLKYYTPCLAARYDELKPEQQKNIFQSRDWVATLKENGVRGWLIWHKGSMFLFSRNYSDKDCGLPEYWGNIYQTTTLGENEIYAMDVEVKFEPGADTIMEELEELGISTDSKLEAMAALLQMNSPEALEIQRRFKEKKGKDLITFRAIHPLYFKGRNYVERTLGEGMQVYKEAVAYGKSVGLNIQEIERCDGTKEEKELFLNNILDSHGEGVVFHNKKGDYCTSENRSKTSFVKLKRSVKATMAKTGIGDSIDGWVSGFKLGSKDTANEGLVAALEISIKLLCNDGRMRDHVVAYVPNIDRKTSEAITVLDENGNPTMSEDFYNVVVEVDGQNISKVSRRLTHPRLLRYRQDKMPEDCIYTEEFINSQID